MRTHPAPLRVVASAITAALVVAACSEVPELGPSCFETGCSEHGRCGLVAASPVCTCFPGYAGPRCETCAPGFSRSEGGLCSASCEGVRCGLHERCGAGARCDCAPGYSRPKGGGECAFTGALLDPGLEEPAEGSPWVVSGAATLVPGGASDSPSPLQRGWARFSGVGRVAQSFAMPTYDEAEPLQLELELACSPGGSCESVGEVYGVTLDDRSIERSLFVTSDVSDLRARSICLGDAAYGHVLTLGVQTYPSRRGPPGERADAFAGRIDIVPSATCPAPGVVANGDFSKGLWPRASGVSLEGFSDRRAEVLADCDLNAYLETWVSVPQKLENPALTFTVGGGRDSRLSATIDGAVVGVLRPTGAATKTVMCLPPWSRGGAFPLALYVQQPPCSLDIGAPRPSALLLDDFAVTSDASCAEAVFDGGFERGGLALWSADQASIVTSTDAHSGQAYAQLRGTCTQRATLTSPSFYTPARPSGVAGGPALRFFYRRVGDNPARADVDGNSLVLPPASSWTAGSICLLPVWGRRIAVSFAVESLPAGGPCDVTVLDIDDVSVEPDAACPER